MKPGAGNETSPGQGHPIIRLFLLAQNVIDFEDVPGEFEKNLCSAVVARSSL